jgi:hypothetical protein
MKSRIMKNKVVAIAAAFALASGAAETALLAAGQQTATIAGTAKDEAKGNISEYTVRARDVATGMIAGNVPLTADALFTLPDLSSSRYLIELVRHQGNQDRVVCTEGPFDLTTQMLKNDVVIDCGKVPAAWWLLGAAAAAGITAGIVAANASPSQ